MKTKKEAIEEFIEKINKLAQEDLWRFAMILEEGAREQQGVFLISKRQSDKVFLQENGLYTEEEYERMEKIRQCAIDFLNASFNWRASDAENEDKITDEITINDKTNQIIKWVEKEGKEVL